MKHNAIKKKNSLPIYHAIVFVLPNNTSVDQSYKNIYQKYRLV